MKRPTPILRDGRAATPPSRCSRVSSPSVPWSGQTLPLAGKSGSHRAANLATEPIHSARAFSGAWTREPSTDTSTQRCHPTRVPHVRVLTAEDTTAPSSREIRTSGRPPQVPPISHCLSSPSFAHLALARPLTTATAGTASTEVVKQAHPCMSLVADVGGTVLAARSSKGMVVTCDVDEGRLEIHNKSQVALGGISSLMIGQAI